MIKIHEELSSPRVLDDQGGEQTNLCSLDRITPRAYPERFKFNQSFADLVVELADFSRIFGVHQRLVVLEHLHWVFDATEQLPCPHDISCNRRRVANHWRCHFVLLIQVLHGENVLPEIVENDSVLAAEVPLERIPVDGIVECAKQCERTFSAMYVVKTRVYEIGKTGLELSNIDVEFEEISVKSVLSVV